MKQLLKINVIRDDPFSFGPRIIPYYEHPDGRTEVGKMTFEQVERGACITNDLGFVLDPNSTQSLMDQLWQAGYRPTKEVGTTGQLKATENHLQDSQEQTKHWRELSEHLLTAVIPPKVEVKMVDMGLDKNAYRRNIDNDL